MVVGLLVCFLHVLVVGQALASSLASKTLLLQTLNFVQQFLLVNSGTRLFVFVIVSPVLKEVLYELMFLVGGMGLRLWVYFAVSKYLRSRLQELARTLTVCGE